jgi:acyl-CoA dehydrogenase
MINFELSEEQKQIQDTVRKFVESEVMPVEQRVIEREIEGNCGASPGLSQQEMKSLQDKARELGFWGIDTPEEYGGADLDPVTQAVVHVELGKTIVDFDFGGSVLPALYSCDGTQKEKYLLPTLQGERVSAIAISEPGSGSDARAMRTTAVRDGDSWVINGEKCWITRGNIADYAILFARTPGEGDPNGITCFLVDRANGWSSTSTAMMGSRDKVASLYFSDVRVNNSAILGNVNNGFEHAMPFIYRNRAYILSAKSIGAMERLLSLAIEWSKEREIFGKKLSERENIAFAIAEMEAELRAAKFLVFHAAWRAATGQDYRHEACIAKVHVARTANKVVDKVLQIHGAMGYAKESVVERWYRDLRVERIYDGSDEVNLSSISRNLFRGFVGVAAIF